MLILTNDGDFAKRVTHPSFEIKKVYIATLDGAPPVMANVQMLGPLVARVTIHEGKNRQVRKMFEAVGVNVLALKRISIGGLGLGDLAVGSWRYLDQRDISCVFAESD